MFKIIKLIKLAKEYKKAYLSFVKNEINGWFNMSKKQEELTNFIERHII